MVDSVNYLTPVGRLVQGSLTKPNTTNMQGKPLLDKLGAPRVEYFIAIAIAKTDPGWNDFYSLMHQAGALGFPNLFPGGVHSGGPFSWKLADGDGLDSKNQPYNLREGHAGCWIIKMTSGFCPKSYTRLDNPTGPVAEILPERIKRGDWVRVSGSFVANMNAEKPGIYINPQNIELVYYGDAIQGGQDGTEAFADAAGSSMPAGASATPTAGAAPVAPAAAPAGAPPPPVAPVTTAAAPPPVAPAAAPAAAPAGAPPPPPVAPAAAAPPPPPVTPAPEILQPPAHPPGAPGHVMTDKAGAITYASFIEQHWTDEKLIESGYMEVCPF